MLCSLLILMVGMIHMKGVWIIVFDVLHNGL